MGTPISVHIVEQLLDEHGYHRRKALKDVPLGEHRDRDAQFQNIARLKQEYLDGLDPVLSIDTKKRELLGKIFTVPGQLLDDGDATDIRPRLPQFRRRGSDPARAV